jgi:hypothetical protein
VRPAEIQIEVEGCLAGTRLTRPLFQPHSVEQEVLKATEFVLEGPKELLKLLSRDHNRHQEIISGVAIIPPSPDGVTVDSTTKKIGPNKITLGVRQRGAAGGAAESANLSDAPRPIRIRVTASTHVADRCLSRN